MSEFLRLLSLCYACEIAAETQFPSPEEWTRCMGYYHEVKVHFADDLNGAAAQIEGYRRWKEWEAMNPQLVETLRDRARRG